MVPLTVGFLFGGVAGALAAGIVSSSSLRWNYVLYLAMLDALLIFWPPHQLAETTFENVSGPLPWGALLAVGIVAGFSSGLLGIGGGLAITAGLGAGLRVPQHQAQLVSLVFSIVPTTIPAAWVYWREGWNTSWPVIGGVVVGLWAGTDADARLANRFDAIKLHRVLLGFVSAMAIYMAYKAIE